MADQTRNRKYEVYDFVSTPIGLVEGAGSSRGNLSEVSSAPAIPSFYGGPDRQQEAATQQAPTPRPAVPAGWHLDPAGRHQQRFWDGGAWTSKVADAGTMGLDVGPLVA